MKLVTFNIRCSWDKDGINSFLHRVGLILDTIDRRQPDIICFQEVTERIFAFMEHRTPGYAWYWHGRNADGGGEGLAYAYKKGTVTLSSVDCFWLSDTPRVAGSRFAEQSKCPRICLPAVFRNKETGEEFRIYNNHLDHISDNAKLSGIKLVLDRVALDQKALSLPIFILGDFNALTGSAPIEYCQSFAAVPLGEATAPLDKTFHGFGASSDPRKIDYIFTDVSTAEKIRSLCRWEDTADGIYLSDHFPLEIEW